MGTEFAQAMAAIDQWLEDVDVLAAGVARGLSVELFNEAVKNSAQYSGDFASNWRYSVGHIDTTFVPLMATHPGRQEHGHLERFLIEPRIQGDARAIRWAKAGNAGKDLAFTKLGQTAYISNSAVHDEPYAWLIEENQIKFRTGNSGAPLSRALKKVEGQYGATISRTEALRLISTHIGA